MFQNNIHSVITRPSFWKYGRLSWSVCSVRCNEQPRNCSACFEAIVKQLSFWYAGLQGSKVYYWTVEQMRLSHRSVYKASWTLRKVITNPAEHFVVIASFLCFRWVGHRKLFITTKRKEFKGNILMFLMLCSLRPPLFCPLLFLSHSFLDLILLCFLFSFVCCLFLPSCFETFADLHGNGSCLFITFFSDVERSQQCQTV